MAVGVGAIDAYTYQLDTETEMAPHERTSQSNDARYVRFSARQMGANALPMMPITLMPAVSVTKTFAEIS